MSTYTDAEAFLQAVFGSDFGTHCIVVNLNPPAHFRRVVDLDETRDCYWSIAAFGPEAKTNLGGGALETRALVIDDVGTKVPALNVEMALGEPTAIVESSAGNFQWVYRLSSPVAVGDWQGFFGAVEAAVGGILDGRSAVHLFRLPMGHNTKPGKCMFPVRLVELNPGNELDVGNYPLLPRAAQGSVSAPEPRLAHIRKFLALIPNPDLPYDEWMACMQRVKALAIDEAEALEAFLEWSAKSPKHNEEETRRRWDTVRPDRTSGLLLLREAEAADPAGFAAATGAEARAAFDDGVVAPDPSVSPPGVPPDPAAGLSGGSFQFGDPTKIPVRDWLYGRILIRKFMSMTVAPGGSGKSSLVLAECVAMASGRNLLGTKPRDQLGVWYWNLEDPLEEVSRRLHAVSLRYGVTNSEIGGRLFVSSGRDTPLVLVKMDGGRPVVQEGRVAALVGAIRARGVDVLVIDPYVSSHEVGENDNVAQDMVVKTFGRIAEAGGCAVHLVDHTRKVRTGEGAEVGTESARGAKAKTDAARMVRVINRMTQKEADALGGVPDAWRHFHASADKANMAPPVDDRDWFRLATVNLGNGAGARGAFGSLSAGVVHGDDVGVVEEWTPPTPAVVAASTDFMKVEAIMKGKKWRADRQSKTEPWVGIALGEGLGFDPKTDDGKKRAATLVKAWLKAGILKSVAGSDANRKAREYIEIAPKSEY